MPTPIVIFAYARPMHTARMLESLASNDGVSECDVIAFLDGPKTPAATARVQEVRALIESVKRQHVFRSVEIVQSSCNRGLARSVIEGVSNVLERHERVIVVEDDLELSSDFVAYMNATLEFFADDHRIWSVCGHSPVEFCTVHGYGRDFYLSPRGGSWGWGTWRDRWNLVDWEVRDYGKSFEFRPMRRRAMNRGGRDMAAMLDAQMDGRIDSWAIRWCYSQFKHDMYTVYPVRSKVRNLGLDGSGTHGVRQANPPEPPHVGPVFLEAVEVDPQMVRLFARSYKSYNSFPPLSFARHIRARWASSPRESA